MDINFDKHKLADEVWEQAVEERNLFDPNEELHKAEFVAAFMIGWETAARVASIAAYRGEGGFHGTWNRALTAMGYTLEEAEEFAGLPPYKPLGSK